MYESDVPHAGPFGATGLSLIRQEVVGANLQSARPGARPRCPFLDRGITTKHTEGTPLPRGWWMLQSIYFHLAPWGVGSCGNFNFSEFEHGRR